MRQLVVEGELVKGFEIDQFRLVSWQDTAGNRGQDRVVLGPHDVLQQHLLGALLLTHPLVIRKVERDRLDPGTRVTGGKDLIHHPNRRFRATVEVLVLVRESAGCARGTAAVI